MGKLHALRFHIIDEKGVVESCSNLQIPSRSSIAYLPHDPIMKNPIRMLMLTLSLTIVCSQAMATNVMCPVLRDREATDEYVTTYQGKTVRFCCNECRQEFEQNAELYVSEVPQLQNLAWSDRLRDFFDTNTRYVAIGLLLTLLIGLRAYGYQSTNRIGDDPPTEAAIDVAEKFATPAPLPAERLPLRQRLLTAKISPVIPLVILCGYLGYEIWSLRDHIASTALAEEIHFATFYDFGTPPVPERPADLENRLSGSYYRGNDERSPRLFNEGNYRTATFHIQLVDAQGTPLVAGDDISDREVFLNLDIDRPPFTPDFLYLPRVMETMFLTRKSEIFLGRDGPVEDAVMLETVEPMQRWNARFSLGKISCCSKELRGVVYVCEQRFYKPHWWSSSEQVGGARMHYGIRYDLATEDGRLTDASDMYMGALYRTRKFPKWKVPMSEWFSHEPIPELPGPNVEDKALLGIDDHEADRGVIAETL